MSVSADVLDRTWHKLGFRVTDKSSHRFAYFCYEDKQVLFTRRSFGRGKLSDHLAQLIRQQMRLNEEQFSSALSCPLDHKGYVEILLAKKLLA